MRELVRGYAAAVLESAESAGRLDSVRGDLVEFARALTSSEKLRRALVDPMNATTTRREIVADLLAGKATAETAALLSFAVRAEKRSRASRRERQRRAARRSPPSPCRQGGPRRWPAASSWRSSGREGETQPFRRSERPCEPDEVAATESRRPADSADSRRRRHSHGRARAPLARSLRLGSGDRFIDEAVVTAASSSAETTFAATVTTSMPT